MLPHRSKMLRRQQISLLFAHLGRPSLRPASLASPVLQARHASTQPPNPNAPAYLKTKAFISVALLASAYAIYTTSASPDGASSPLGGGLFPGKQTFKLNIQTSRGVQSFEFARKPDEEVEKMLHEHETGERAVGRKGNPVVRWDTNWVGSNEPCEDRFASNLVPRTHTAGAGAGAEASGAVGWWAAWWQGQPEPQPLPAGLPVDGADGKKDLMLFSIMDGHAGDATSKLLEKALHPTVSMALASLQAGYVPNASAWERYLSPWYWLGAGKVWTPGNVAASIQKAYLDLDESICQTPVRLLHTLNKPSTTTTSPTGEPLPTPQQTFVALAQPAASGACSITTVVDAENDDLYVALAGDCRAVAGWQGADGKWRCDVLTEDQMGETPREVERMKKEHPASERDTVIRNGRVQGGLQPTRAFGDAVYKWTNDQASRIADAFKAEGEKPRAGRPWNFTPPYVTARPEVTYRKLHPETGEQLKFIVMATDGLWDRITSEEATLLTASYLSHPTHSDIPKIALPNLFPLAPPLPADQRPYPAQDLPQPSAEAWVYEGDANAATHLIRNSLAGADKKTRGELLSLTGKVSRWMRDDITVTVVFFGDEGEQ
ncbi:hypothetical protein IAT38_004713 [Cryptococcus sp. DSM 104549]